MLQKFTCHEEVGRGGYSRVLRCKDPTGMSIACKILPKDKNKHHRVQQEVDIMRHLIQCPVTPRLIDTSEDKANYYILQEWFQGHPIKSSYEVLYTERQAALLCKDVLQCLNKLHNAGVVHLDIKPGNILYNDFEMKVIDYGAAIFWEPSNGKNFVDTDEIVGTPHFLAPEYLTHKCAPATDIWSTGVMMYLLLSGSFPFDDWESRFSPRASHLWRSILIDDVKLTGPQWDMISPEAKDFVRVCLNKSWQERPEARELLTHPWVVD